MYHDFDLEKVLNDLKTSKRKNFILDTDAFNEIDDQYAVTYAFAAEDLNVLAFTAAPFDCEKSTGPADGMEKSYQELLKLRGFIDPENKKNIPIYRGALENMKSTIVPVRSEAAENIVRLVNEADDTVYIAAIGCYTNVASALLMDPSIINKCVIILLGGNMFSDDNANDFNIVQDRYAARVILECGVPVAIMPAMGEQVTDAIYLVNAEVSYYLKDQAGRIGNYLCYLIDNERKSGPYGENGEVVSYLRGFCDIGAVVFAHNPSCFSYRIVAARTIDGDGRYKMVGDGRKMIYVNDAHRDEIVSDFYNTVRKYGSVN